MYEQVSHSLLNEILERIRPEVRSRDLQHFYTRLGANFFALYSLFRQLYGEREDFREQMFRLVASMVDQYMLRSSELKQLDLEREKDHNWFLHQKWVGMALYCRQFAGDLPGLQSRLGFLQDLGVNMVHIMPILDCPQGRSDGGYAVRDFRNIDQRIGMLEDLAAVEAEMRARGMLLTLDVVVNHTSEEHEWAVKARQGDKTYQDYYYIFDDRTIPDLYEQSMPEVFPETAPGNFTWNEEMGKWVMTVFNTYQWDLNYRNPAVFIEMLDIILYWANRGADILRLDAVAFLWKEIGTTCQNQRNAHLILQLMKDCCQVVAPGVLFIAEAIVAPVEIAKYFGEDAINAKECEIAYNATYMALLWDAVATHKATLLNFGLRSIPQKLERATWLNYVRCHDDIGWGFSDTDIQLAGYDPKLHRRFLVDYFTGMHSGSHARGLAFARNEKTGDARISGSTASLSGLEYALEYNLPDETEAGIKTILLLHSMILAFGGIPLFYYADVIGMPNDRSYLQDEYKSADNRWIHRPTIDWDKAERRNQPGTIEFQVFGALKKMVAVRKEIKAFADYDNRELLDVGNPHLFVFSRTAYLGSLSKVLVVGNFDVSPQLLDLKTLLPLGFFQLESVKDLYSGESFSTLGDQFTIPPLTFYWLEA